MIQSPDEGAQSGINIVMASNAPLAAILGLTEQTYVEGRRKNTQRDYFTVLFGGARKTGPERESAGENQLYETWKGKP